MPPSPPPPGGISPYCHFDFVFALIPRTAHPSCRPFLPFTPPPFPPRPVSHPPEGISPSCAGEIPPRGKTTLAPGRPHESTGANRIKGTFRGLYYERDAEPSQRAIKMFYSVRLFRLVWGGGAALKKRCSTSSEAKKLHMWKHHNAEPSLINSVICNQLTQMCRKISDAMDIISFN